ncbi:MAG: hypothetical protein ACLTEH_05110 [Clostridia bacterium]
MDGIYETTINTPMGLISGKVTLKANGNILNGVIETMGMKNALTGGKVNGNTCSFSGTMQNNMLNITYDIKGELKGNILYIHAKTNMGEFQLQGKKIG